jgi:hypothetical protein
MKFEMEALIVKISGKTSRGKHLIGLLKDLAKAGDDIEIENIPNEETGKSVEDARNKKGYKAESVKELFQQLEARDV